MMFTGDVYWSDHDGWDDDYNLKLAINDYVGEVSTPNTSAGLNAERPAQRDGRRVLQLEFDSDETVERWDGTWWGDTFHHAVDVASLPRFPPDGPNQLIDRKRAIVIGKWGMDCNHLCWAEVHPVLGAAVRTSRVSTSRAGLIASTDEEWQVFYRSQGDQGPCGISPDDDVDEQLRNDTTRWMPIDMSFRFEAPDWANWVAVSFDNAWKKSFADSPTLERTSVQGRGMVLTISEFHFDAWWSGTVKIEWSR